MLGLLAAASCYYVVPQTLPRAGVVGRRAAAAVAYADEPSVNVDGLSELVPTGSSNIVEITSVAELQTALSASRAAGRLAVVKCYAPWCAACRMVQPKYERAAKDMPEHDWFEVNFAAAKPLCKHLGISKLPTGIIYEDGEQVSFEVIKKGLFKTFLRSLEARAEAMSARAELPEPNMDGLRARLAELADERMDPDAEAGPEPTTDELVPSLR